MRALHLISSGGIYGAENMMLSLCTGLRRQGCDTVVGVFLNSHRPNIDTTNRAKRLGLECTTFSCDGRLDLSTVRAIRSYILKNGIDLIHTHGYKADIYGYAAIRGKSIASVATCHSWLERLKQPPLSLRLYGVLDKAALRRFGIVAAVSEKHCIVSYWRGGLALRLETTVFEVSEGNVKRKWVSNGGGLNFRDLKNTIESGRILQFHEAQ